MSSLKTKAFRPEQWPCRIAARLRSEWPLLVLTGLFALRILLMHSPDLEDDERRYWDYAQRLLRGSYAPAGTVYLWNGPGYPLFLAPFAFFEVPVLFPRLANSLLLAGGLYHFRSVLSAYLPRRHSLWAATALGIVALLHDSLSEKLMTESLSFFLFAGVLRHGCKAAVSRGFHSTAAALYLAALCLTKVFFAYPALALALLCAGIGVAMRAPWARRTGLIAVMALFFCGPYLIYTFQLTGRPFYWSNAGGLSLFWMSAPEKHLYGDWVHERIPLAFPEHFPSQAPVLAHQDAMDAVALDDTLKALARENIRKHPEKYFRNWRANVNRLVFGFPFSHYPGSGQALGTGNRAFVYVLPFACILMGAMRMFHNRMKPPPELLPWLCFTGLSLLGLSLLSAFPRFVFPLLPAFGVFFALAFRSSHSDSGSSQDSG